MRAGIPASELDAIRGRVIELAASSPSLVGNPRMPSREELATLLEAAASVPASVAGPPVLRYLTGTVFLWPLTSYLD